MWFLLASLSVSGCVDDDYAAPAAIAGEPADVKYTHGDWDEEDCLDHCDDACNDFCEELCDDDEGGDCNGDCADACDDYCDDTCGDG
ncbi:MAG: hypothetical protein ACOZNI_04040 [Myxococcota bacterium]